MTRKRTFTSRLSSVRLMTVTAYYIDRLVQSIDKQSYFFSYIHESRTRKSQCKRSLRWHCILCRLILPIPVPNQYAKPFFVEFEVDLAIDEPWNHTTARELQSTRLHGIFFTEAALFAHGQFTQTIKREKTYPNLTYTALT